MVAEGDGLGGLQVCEARHQRIGVLFSAIQQGILIAHEQAIHMVNRAPHPQAKIGRYLVVA